MIILPKHYGPLLRILHFSADQAINGALESMDLTSAQGHILGFTGRQESPPCPRDIEEAFHLSHPTVSGLLSRMEKKGFIELRTDERDRRCKRIFILPKGQECNKRIYRTIVATEERLVADFSEEEKRLFRSLLQRAIINVGGAFPAHVQEPKEEP